VNWIRVDVSIGRDSSVGDVAMACGVSRPLATGHWVLFLTAMAEGREDGDVSRISDENIEAWAYWRGKKGRFARAVRTHLCDERGVVRSWWENNGSKIREMEADRQRKKAARLQATAAKKSGGRPAEQDQTSGGCPPLRDGTGRDVTNYLTTTASGTAHAATDPALELVHMNANKLKAPPAFPHFPVALCKQLHALWVSTFGACEYARFRKALGSLFTIAEADRTADAPTNGELAAALKSYAELAPMGPGARFANVSNAAGCLAAIARTRRELADHPDSRSDAVMRIIHGKAAA
jgi:hypothetical protein